jgi:hypothetical protein
MPLRDDPTLAWNLSGCVAYYQPVLAPGPELARYNQMHGGTNMYRAADGTAPTWAPATGWTFAAASSQYLTTSSMVPGTPITMICRFMVDDVANDYSLLNLSAGVNSYTHLQADGTQAGDPVRAHYVDGLGMGGAAASTTSMAANTWHVGAGVWPTTSLRFAYLDGAGKGQEATVCGNFTPTTVLIGKLNLVPWPNYLNGKIASAAIYSRALVDTEIWLIAQQMKYLEQNPDWSCWGRRREWWHLGTAAAAYSQAVAGAQTNTGMLIRGTATAKAGSQTNTGAIVKAIGTSEAGALPPSGGVVRETATSKAGAMANTGALVRGAGKVLAGAWSGDGAMTRLIGKAVAGAWSSSGAIVRAIGKAVAGAWSGAGAVGSPAITVIGMISLTLFSRSLTLTLHTRGVTLTVDQR